MWHEAKRKYIFPTLSSFENSLHRERRSEEGLYEHMVHLCENIDCVNGDEHREHFIHSSIHSYQIGSCIEGRESDVIIIIIEAYSGGLQPLQGIVPQFKLCLLSMTNTRTCILSPVPPSLHHQVITSM